MYDKQAVNELFSHALNTVNMAYQHTAELPSHITILQTSEDKQTLEYIDRVFCDDLGLPIDTEESFKNRISAVFKMAAHKFGCAVYCSEAWVVTGKKEDIDSSPSPSESPNRQEMVMISILLDGEQYMALCPVSREGAHPLASPAELAHLDKNYAVGRFIDDDSENQTHH